VRLRVKERGTAVRRLAGVNPRIALGVLLLAGACGASHSGPSAASVEPSVAPVVSISPPTTMPLQTCTSRDLHADVVWDAGFFPTGGTSVETRTGGLEMTGQLNVWNVSTSSCVLPGRFTVRIVGATGHELSVRSVERNFGLSGFDWNGPLAPGRARGCADELGAQLVRPAPWTHGGSCGEPYSGSWPAACTGLGFPSGVR
jgi:hypothetical protein